MEIVEEVKKQEEVKEQEEVTEQEQVAQHLQKEKKAVLDQGIDDTTKPEMRSMGVMGWRGSPHQKKKNLRTDTCSKNNDSS